jgi:putative hydrolase
MPAPASDQLMAVPEAIDAFAKEWDLAPDDVRMYVCLRDVVHHAVLSRPHVSKALEDHLLGYTGAFRVEAGFIEQRLGTFDPSDLMSFQESLGDPEALLGEMQSDEQRRLLVPFRAFLAALAGYTDFIIDKVGQRLVGSYPLINEAFRRRRLEDGPGQRVLGKLLGVELDQTTVDRGHAFINGVLERAGEEGLSRLWSSAATLPTPPEVDAPGLWLARIELPD